MTELLRLPTAAARSDAARALGLHAHVNPLHWVAGFDSPTGIGFAQLHNVFAGAIKELLELTLRRCQARLPLSLSSA